MKFSKFLTSLFLISTIAHAKLNVLTTTKDLASIAQEVAGAHADVDSLGKGTQDPHYIEAKPSFMLKASKADLVIATGLELEIGWLPSIIGGARNPKINPGSKGYLEVGNFVDTLEKPVGKVSRADGDVHPFGNPHITLDPVRAGQIAGVIAKKLSELDPGSSADYQKSADGFAKRLQTKTEAWKKRIVASGVKKVVTYHKTLSYFLDRFGIEGSAILEPKPGIPPTSGHILEVIQQIKTDKIPLVLIENYFDPTPAKKIETEVSGIRSAVVPVSVDGAPGIEKLDDLYEALTKAVEGK